MPQAKKISSGKKGKGKGKGKGKKGKRVGIAGPIAKQPDQPPKGKGGITLADQPPKGGGKGGH